MLNNQVLEIKQNISRLTQAKKFKEACSLAEKLTQISPNDPEVWWVLATLHQYCGNNRVALSVLLKLAERPNPLQHRALSHAAELALKIGEFEAGYEVAKILCDIDKDSTNAKLKLALFTYWKRDYPAAISKFQEYFQSGETEIEALDYCGLSYVIAGEIREAMQCFDKSIALYGHPGTKRIRAMASNYTSSLSNDQVYKIHKDAAASVEQSAGEERQDFAVPVGSGGKIRIGICSEDLRDHSVAFFLKAVLGNYDKSLWSITLFSDTDKPDQVTELLKNMVDDFVDVSNFTDETYIQNIEAKKIDILMDLMGYFGKNRYAVFAKRTAPIQVAYLGYPNTSGLKAMDFRIVDQVTDPDGDEFYSESLYRLGRSFICYSPSDDSPEISLPPASTEENGQICFGSFNAFRKISEANLKVWLRILKNIPQSSLLIKSIHMTPSYVIDKLAPILKAENIAADRLVILGKEAKRENHLALYKKVDIHLDTFPYNGTTTTCEALWQGVPTITLAGDSHRSRVGASILHHVGLDDWIASSEDEYVSIAVEKAKDLEALMALRVGMRARMSESSLMDAKGMVSSLEQAFKTMINEKSASL